MLSTKHFLFQEERQQLLGGGGRRPGPRPRQRVVDTFQGNTTLNLSSKQIWVRSSTRPRPWKRPEETSKTMKKRQEETLKAIKRQERTSKTMKKNSKRPWKKTGRDFKHPIFQLSRPRSVFVTQTGATTRISSLRWDWKIQRLLLQAEHNFERYSSYILNIFLSWYPILEVRCSSWYKRCTVLKDSYFRGIDQ